MSQYEAVRLFIERAPAVQPDFVVTEANAPAVAQICFHLDGIPLAIELAAARVRSLSVEEINARLDNRFRLLTGGPRNTLPRQQTLRALIDWCYDLLTEQEQALLRAGCPCSQAGGRSRRRKRWARARTPRRVIEDWEVVDLLMRLVDKSLVVYEGKRRAADASACWRRCASTQASVCRESGEAEAIQARAAAWFLGLAEEAEPQLMGPEQAVWLKRLETEHDNLRASLAWYDRAEGAEAGLRLVGALCRFWAVRGHYFEGRQWADRALQKAQNGANGSDAADVSAAQAKANFGAGYLAYNQGDYLVTEALYQKSLTLYRSLEDQRGIASVLDSLGNVAYELGDYLRARSLYEESLALARQLANQRSIASLARQPGECRPGNWRLRGGARFAQGMSHSSAAVGRPAGGGQLAQ